MVADWSDGFARRTVLQLRRERTIRVLTQPHLCCRAMAELAKLVLLYVTTPNAEEARHIARCLVQERLCACANIGASLLSVYEWKGKAQEDEEVQMVLKTQESRIDAATRRIRELHSYETPCVVALPLAGGDEEFLQWVVTQTSRDAD